MYTKAYSLSGTEASLRIKQTFELSEFELSLRFYCMLQRIPVWNKKKTVKRKKNSTITIGIVFGVSSEHVKTDVSEDR